MALPLRCIKNRHGRGDDAVAASGAAGPQDMGKVMGILKPKLAGRADMTAVSAQVKKALAGG